jgi:UDP-N-acetylglucosamine--N-acetylmuramyl-(pentapeptide) pyrophosphoryl-undecaprenol N-acetylglucosamine transferase
VNRPTLLFAGGGTGGHVFPMLAVADALLALRADLRLVFVGTARGLEAKLVPARGHELELIEVEAIRGRGVAGALSGVQSAARSLPKSRDILRRQRPALVFSVGGYAAGPVSLAARSMGLPLALLEPNADIGLANRLVAPFVSRAYTAFPEAARFFSPNAVLETGVPIRAGFAPKPLNPFDGEFRVLVLGGSQGAKSLNEQVPRALGKLAGRVTILHQCGPAHEEATRALYAELGLETSASVTPFIDDMPEAIARAELVIGRAGASAVSEICAVGRPSLLVPYPYAGDHQRFNALSLSQRGAAITVLTQDANPERLAREIEALRAEPARLESLAKRARDLGRPDAALSIAQDLLRMAGLAAETPEPSAAKPPATRARGWFTSAEAT